MRKNNANREREKQEEKKGESTEYSEQVALIRKGVERKQRKQYCDKVEKSSQRKHQNPTEKQERKNKCTA